MAERRTIGIVFIDRFADWEFGLLTGSAPEWFGGRIISISADGKPVRSQGGLTLTPDRRAQPDENADLDAIAVIGSDVWAGDKAPDIAPLLQAVAARGGVVGGICAGTLAVARSGLFANARHTSNEREWLDGVLPDYPGRANYEQLPYAVADGRIISAPGSAPGTFAVAMLTAIFPDKADMMPELRAMFAAEYTDAS